MRRPLPVCLLITALVVSLACSQAFAAGQACQCHDRPNEPCVQEDLYLEHVAFPPASESVFRRNLDEIGDSDVWLLIQVVPNGACKDCEQTYLAYFPDLDTDTPDTVAYYINPRTSGASDQVFSMIECSPRSGYTVTVAMIELEGSYSSDYDRISGILSPALILAESGNAGRTGSRAWSVRLQGAFLPFLFDRLNDGFNQIILCPITITPPTPSAVVAAHYPDAPVDVTYQQSADCDPTRKRDCDPSRKPPRDCSGKVSFWMGARSMVVTPCSLRCAPSGPKDTPTQAENHFAGRDRCHLVSVVASLDSDGSQYSSRQTGQPGVPTNAKSVEMTTKRYTRTEPDGSTVQFVQVVQVIRFSDGSTYVASYTRQTVTKNGRIVSDVTDCLHSAFLSGYDVARLSALNESRTETGVNYMVWGGSPSVSLDVPTDLMAVSGMLPDQIELVASAGAALDLTSLPGAAAVALTTPRLSARSSITVRADAITLPEGATLASLIDPDPTVLPGVTGLLIVVPDVVPIAAEGDTLFVLIANRSALPDTVTLRSTDALGWVQRESTDLYLAPGQVGAIALHALPDQGATTSALLLTATGMQPGAVDAREVELVILGGETAPSATTAAPSLPQEVQDWARALAWKGGWLGRTDPSMRWDAREDRPGESCVPCGGAPMCIVCMESDLQAWLWRPKSLSELVALMSLQTYLNQVKAQPEYSLVAALYWDAHWDGWHNRDAP